MKSDQPSKYIMILALVIGYLLGQDIRRSIPENIRPVVIAASSSGRGTKSSSPGSSTTTTVSASESPLASSSDNSNSSNCCNSYFLDGNRINN